jgi:hypothetical protein
VCFSASANFVGSAVLGAIGVATLAEVKHRRELLFAAMPCFFKLAGLLVVMEERRYEFTSIWCAYAAVVSIVIYFFFRRSREGRPADYAREAVL